MKTIHTLLLPALVTAFLVALILALNAQETVPELTARANRLCEDRGGVSRIEAANSIVICKDGYAHAR